MTSKPYSAPVDLNKVFTSSCTLKKVLDSSTLVNSVLLKHNLKCKVDDCLESFLCENGYYYFSGYRRVFLTTYESGSWSGTFENNVSVDWLYYLIQIDRNLGSILLKFANIVERRLKSRSAYFLSTTKSEDMHLYKSNFQSPSYWKKTFKPLYTKVLENGKRDDNPIIRHHLNSYDGRLPIWVFFEHISFGEYLHFMSQLELNVKMKTFDDIFHSTKAKYPIRNYMSAAAILDMLTIIKMVRNRIAHLGRLYDWKFHYTIGSKTFTPAYSLLFDPTRDDYYLNDILDVYGFFLLEEDHDNLIMDVAQEMVDICKKIPAPYCDRIISLMGYQRS